MWLSDDIPIGQWEGIRGVPDKRANEKIPRCTGSLNDLSSTNECLVERQNRALENTLRVFCSRYMTNWDKYLPQVMGAYNSTQHSTTGISSFMMLTGRERAMPLAFFYPEYEGKKTSPQAYVKKAVRRY